MLAKSIRVKATLIALMVLALGACASSSQSSGDNANPPQQQQSKPYMGY